jgi:hypothetical protein
MPKHRMRAGYIVLASALTLAAGLGLSNSVAQAGHTETVVINGKRYTVLTRDTARNLQLMREWQLFKRWPGPFLPPRPEPDPPPFRAVR